MKQGRRILSGVLAAAMACTMGISGISPVAASAAAKVKVAKVTVTKPAKKKLVMTKGKTYQIKAKATGKKNKKATNQKFTYKSSKTKYVTVTAKGKLTAKKVGTSKITVASKENKKKKATFTVQVKKAASNTTATGTPEPTAAQSASPSAVVTGTPAPTATAAPTETPAPTAASTPVINAEGYTLKFEDEFDGTELDTENWNYEDHEPGWVNNELQSYVTEEENKETQNIMVQDGTLILQAHSKLEGKGKELIQNGDFANGLDDWGMNGCWGDNPLASFEAGANGAVIDINNTGENNWDVQLKKENFTMENGRAYKISLTIDSTVARTIKFACMNKEYVTYGEGDIKLKEGKDTYEVEFTVEDGKITTENGVDAATDLVISMGKVNDDDPTDGTITLEKVSLIDVEAENFSYTSGRVNTQNKQDYKYGLIEARIKFPSGKGFLPAFWMMPTEEGLYGQWPRCGEIDISEVLGDKTDTTYGTIHYGYPYRQRQGSYTLDEGTFADDFHVFSLEWEPGELRYYVDGKLFNTINNWYTANDGEDPITYPAPYDQPYYVILNLAVGGNWPGNPDETTEFGENARVTVDYVRIFQKDGYDENVTEKPEKEDDSVVLRDPDANGNYVNNGDFSTDEDLADGDDWKFQTAGTGEGSAEIKDGEIIIHTENDGDLDYSIQLMSQGLPLKKRGEYKLSFDAYADEERTTLVGICGPDNGYIRYFGDDTVELKTAKTHYEYDFLMRENTDANARLDFNAGAAGSTADIHISNVKLVKTGEVEVLPPVEIEKNVMADGNYVYNGTFDRGEDRMKYWEVSDGADAAVTNENNVRKLKVTVAEGGGAVTLTQKDIPLAAGADYQFSADIEGAAADSLDVTVGGKKLELAKKGDKYVSSFKLDMADEKSSLVISISAAGETFLDNIRITEDALLQNGSFSNGLTGWADWGQVAGNYSVAVDSMAVDGDGNKNDNAAAITVKDTGTEDWHIQLKQENVTLQEGHWYKISFDAWTTAADGRDIRYVFERDGSNDGDWTVYNEDGRIVQLDGKKKHEDQVFQMTKPTDDKAILQFWLGMVDRVITEKHDVYIDNVVLTELSEDEIPS